MLGTLPGSGSRWKPSPGFRFGYNVPNNFADEHHVFYLCDLEQETFRRIKFEGGLRGWWDETHILINDRSDNLVLYDVLNGKTSPLLSQTTIERHLQANGISAPPGSVETISHWNGMNYDFLLAPKNGWARYTNTSFIFKLARPSAALELISTNFQFRWGGTFNDDLTKYIYGGESGATGKGGNGGVFLEDIRNGKMTTLVQPDNQGQYSLARFCNNTVIYWRNRELWSINTNGASDERLFPPPEK